MLKRNFAPGQHGPTNKHSKLSGYGKQLREKQRAKRIYGLLERQFSNYVTEASKKIGDTSKFLIAFLESRLDNVIYRAGLASSRSAARQMVRHGHILVDGKKVDIPSYQVGVGEVLSLHANSKNKKMFEKITEKLSKAEVLPWLSVNPKDVTIKILNTPVLESPEFNAKAIIEFYSR